jgi:hypothetical protein
MPTFHLKRPLKRSLVLPALFPAFRSQDQPKVSVGAANGMLVMQWPPRISSIPSVTIGDVSLLLFD